MCNKRQLVLEFKKGVTGSKSVCVSVWLSVLKDLTNRWTDMVLLHSVATHRSFSFLTILGAGIPNLPRENKVHRKQLDSAEKRNFLFDYTSKLKFLKRR